MTLHSRREILSVLNSSAESTGMHLLSEGPGHSHRITILSRRDKEKGPVQFRAVLLVRSSDWYRYRLNVFGKLQGIELIVCGKHDSCMQIQVWSVEEAKVYQPGETATPLAQLADPKVRGTKYGSLLFVAALLSDKQEARSILTQKDFPRSTRYRYQAKVRQYANLKSGNKLKIS
jgi:hypothetical protein